MLALLPVLVPILVVDVINPVLFALLVFIVGLTLVVTFFRNGQPF